VLLGLACLVFAGSAFPLKLALASFFGLLAFDAVAILFNRALLNAVISLVNRLFKKEFGHFHVTRRLLVELHAIHLCAAVASGVAACMFCRAMGYELTLNRALLLVSASLVADVAGFLAIIVPGGLGVREGLMYAMLGGAASGSLALVLPVASRLMNMGVDVVLGAVALRLLRTLTSHKTLVDLPEAEP
jgi:uncharacterized membrane protein YbhN (UPF0104 family)